MDICFATRHWLDDQKVVRKRKTELGGTLSIASWIVFIGLFAALLYQIISKRSVEVHNLRATNAPDLVSFVNDMEFNITTISSMSCSNLRGLGTLVTGNPGFIDHRVVPLSRFANYSCINTSKGPTVTIKCDSCKLFQDSLYISWQFVDLSNNPAAAVGFEFNLTAKNHASKKHTSFVSGTLKNGSNFDDSPVTFRGSDSNMLKFNLFPRIVHNLHGLKLMQPLFHEFLPGSFFREKSQLQASLETPNGALVNTTLYINFLSAYIVEIDNQNILGPVSFLADLGGLYCISIGIFFFILVQCEFRIKRLRNEDSILRKIRNRRKAQARWDKLRKYVIYTWGCSKMDNDYGNAKRDSSCCTEPCWGNRSAHKCRQQDILESISFNSKVSLPGEKIGFPECTHSQDVESCLVETTSKPQGGLSHSKGESALKFEGQRDGKQQTAGSSGGNNSQLQALYSTNDNTLPPPPSLEFKAASEFDMAEIQKNLQSLYEYSAVLREKLVVAQSKLNDLAMKASYPKPETQT